MHFCWNQIAVNCVITMVKSVNVVIVRDYCDARR